MIRLICTVCFLFLISTISSQELTTVFSGRHSLKLSQTEALFSMEYTNMNSSTMTKSSFNFNDRAKLYSIIMDGFNNKKHQIFVKANNDSIVKFTYKQLKGHWVLMIGQDHILSNTSSISSYFNKEQIKELFGSP